MTETRHQQGEAEAAAVAKTTNRVTLDHILSRIDSEEYLHPSAAPHVTICVLTLINGFTVIGKSAPADPENFNLDLGRKIARDQAIAEVWGLEGYLLRERLHGEG
ncbi:Gp49 family protein [Pseudogemmobacter sonorensis]|uniref:Gp49 family protein n=1 Tax=Pseudogemmobacter sonorensis TaxID=2989681 RepID=UPI003690F200